MTISFTPITNIKEVEVEGYGKVRVRPYGAGEELQLSMNIRKLEDVQKQAEKLLEEAKEEYGDDESKWGKDVSEKFKKIRGEAVRLSDELNDITRNILSSEDPKVAERLFRELPMSEVRRLIALALGKEANAKAD